MKINKRFSAPPAPIYVRILDELIERFDYFFFVVFPEILLALFTFGAVFFLFPILAAFFC